MAAPRRAARLSGVSGATLLAAASLPLALIGAWVGWRALRGRPVRRFALNAIVGIALLLYFVVTAALGVFWVANQELPVFDPHYLFGYLTVVLVAVHVAINAPLLMRFARRRKQAVAAAGAARPLGVAWALRAAGVAAVGGTCFWIGYSRGASAVTVRAGPPVAGPGPGAPGQIAEQVVEEDGRALPLWRWYQDRSELSRGRAVRRAAALDVGGRPPVFERYPALAVVPLPPPEEARALAARSSPPTGAALEAAQRAPAALGPAPITLRALGALLHLTQGITSVTGLPTDPFYRRAAASSGALYPTVTHVVVGEALGLAPGLYHYEPRGHALHRVREGDLRGELAARSAHGADLARAPVTLVLSAIYQKTAWKYEERAYRYCLLDVGHVAANAIAAGSALGLASRAIGRFDDAAVAELLGVPPARQGPLVLVALGAPAAPHPPSALEARFAAADLHLTGGGVPASVLLMAGRTSLRATGERGPAPPPAPPLAPRSAAPPLALPADPPHGDPLGPVIERRRSERRFGEGAIEAAQLAALLARAPGASVEDQRGLRVHVVVSRVTGVAPGAYEVRGGALHLVRAGDLAARIHAAALSQEVTARAAAVIVLSVDAAALPWPDASRGYRYGWLDAGIAGGRIYLQGVALGLGVSSVGAFFDGDVAELLRSPPADLPALLVAVGPRSP